MDWLKTSKVTKTALKSPFFVIMFVTNSFVGTIWQQIFGGSNFFFKLNLRLALQPLILDLSVQ